MKINLNYLNLYQEIPLFCALIISGLFRKRVRQKTGNVLIVNTCLIGEFAAALPAIRDYIGRNEDVIVDLMVSPPLKPLAEKVRGVRNVYTARSLYGRHIEKMGHGEQRFAVYDKIFVMRISKDAYRLIQTISADEIHTGLLQYSSYAFHLWGSLIRRRPPKQWREINFEILDGQTKTMPFDDLFQFRESDYADVARLEAFQTTEKKVIIHTGAGWVMKKWNTDKWIELLNRVRRLGDVRFIFVGGAEDADDYFKIASKLEFPLYSLIGKIHLSQLLLVLLQGDYFIGMDSGPRNMAHLVGTRGLTILGPGPHFYMPWSEKDVVIDKSRGRGLYQMFIAKKKGFIHQITVDEVYETFKNRIWNS